MSNPDSIFDWAKEKEVKLLFTLFAKAGKELRFVGGCVRDRLMNLPVTDLDAATLARPEEIIDILNASNIRNLPTGIDHGTITAVFKDRAIEITTLRLDTLCDGRHANVEYTDNWEADAARRDFTVNALYLDEAGTVHDFFTGLKDLADKRIRFIGDATARIREDYLRILRFFRFLATHGQPPADVEALTACKATKDKLETLSGERIQKEMLKLLGAANPLYALGLMQETGVLDTIIAGKAEVSFLPLLLNLEKESRMPTDSLLRLSLVLGEDRNASLAERWRLSGAGAKRLTLYLSHPDIFSEAPYLLLKRAIRTYGPEIATQLLFRDAVKNSLTFAGMAPLLELTQTWQAPIFPVSGDDLMAVGFKQGKELGEAIKKLETVWEESDYTLQKQQLLATL